MSDAQTIQTKYGTATVMAHGYYQITSGKEGNAHKLLHRLIYEDANDCEIPIGMCVHHKNGDKLDNDPNNLELLSYSDHAKIHGLDSDKYNHFKGEHHSEETKQHLSEVLKGKEVPLSQRIKTVETVGNSTGYFRVQKHKCKTCIQGFIYEYRIREKGRTVKISSVSLEKLEEKVKAKGYEWRAIP